MVLSLYVFFGLFGLLMIYDLIIIIRRGYSATVSANLFAFARRYPIVPFGFGIVVGHLWWVNESACVQLRDAGELPAERMESEDDPCRHWFKSKDEAEKRVQDEIDGKVHCPGGYMGYTEEKK